MNNKIPLLPPLPSEADLLLTKTLSIKEEAKNIFYLSRGWNIGDFVKLDNELWTENLVCVLKILRNLNIIDCRQLKKFRWLGVVGVESVLRDENLESKILNAITREPTTIKTIIQVIGPLPSNQRLYDTMCVLEVFNMIEKVQVDGERQKYYRSRV